MHIEIAFAEPKLQQIIVLELPTGATIEAAIAASNIQHDHPEVLIDPKLVGVWNRKRSMDYVLKEGDRVEIYRPLIADPKEVRRQRAQQQA